MTKIILSRSERMKAVKNLTKRSNSVITVLKKPITLQLPRGLKCNPPISYTYTWDYHLSESPYFDYFNKSITLKFKVDGEIDGEPYLKKTEYTQSGWMGLIVDCVIIPASEVVDGNIKFCYYDGNPKDDPNSDGYYNNKNKSVSYVLPKKKTPPPSTSLPEIEQSQQRLTFTFTLDNQALSLIDKPFKLLVYFVLEYRDSAYYFYYP